MEILIIDNDLDIAGMLAEVFVDEGYTVETVTDLTQAKERLPIAEPTVILLDLSMHNQIQTSLHTIRNEWAKAIPIILMSASPQPLDLNRFRAVEFLRKPFDFEELLDVAKRYSRT